MKKENILKILDIASFVTLIVATILVVVFELTGNMFVMKFGIYMYEVCLLLLLVFTALRIFFVYKKEENKDETFVLSKSQKVWLFVRLALIIVAFCITSIILIKF